MDPSIYEIAKKNLKRTNSIISDVFITEQKKDINYKKEELINNMHMHEFDKLNKKIDQLIKQNNDLKKINLIILDTLNDKFEYLQDIIDGSLHDFTESSYSSHGDIEL